VSYQQGDALALPFEDNRFDVAVMALVIFFVPEPAKGVAEMARVVRAGGTVATYVWYILADASPTSAIQIELRGMGIIDSLPIRADASRLPALLELWSGAGLEAIETRAISVERTFTDFDHFWRSTASIPSVGQPLAAMTAGEVGRLKAQVRHRITEDASGQVRVHARANAIKGCVPPASILSRFRSVEGQADKC
jgi:ubiquinone/menaquinone biosynthesis C-methylase UbiE